MDLDQDPFRDLFVVITQFFIKLYKPLFQILYRKFIQLTDMQSAYFYIQRFFPKAIPFTIRATGTTAISA